MIRHSLPSRRSARSRCCNVRSPRRLLPSRRSVRSRCPDVPTFFSFQLSPPFCSFHLFPAGGRGGRGRGEGQGQGGGDGRAARRRGRYSHCLYRPLPFRRSIEGVVVVVVVVVVRGGGCLRRRDQHHLHHRGVRLPWRGKRKHGAQGTADQTAFAGVVGPVVQAK